MTRAQLTLALRVLRGFGASRTVYALLGLYALCLGLAWLVAQGGIQPDGTMDLRIWVNGHIFDIPTFNLWHWAPAVAALPLGFGVYARSVAAGPLFPVIQTAAPDLAAMIQAMAAAPTCAPQAEPDRPDPVVLQPAGVMAPAGLGSLGSGTVSPAGAGS